MEQLDMFSLLTGAGRRELSFNELARMPGREIELAFRTASHEWSVFGRVVRVDTSYNRRVLCYQTDDAGFGVVMEESFSENRLYHVRAYEVN